MIVKEGDELSTGKHNFIFTTAPMVHWPEVMVSYDKTDKALYSADAFGSFGAINGNLFDSEVDFEKDYIDEARRYYTNIVGKYGPQVQMLLKKAAALDIKVIYPLHGLIIKDNISKFVEKYDKWSKYEAEEKSVLIAYSSVYGGTENGKSTLRCDRHRQHGYRSRSEIDRRKDPRSGAHRGLRHQAGSSGPDYDPSK